MYLMSVFCKTFQSAIIFLRTNFYSYKIVSPPSSVRCHCVRSLMSQYTGIYRKDYLLVLAFFVVASCAIGLSVIMDAFIP